MLAFLMAKLYLSAKIGGNVKVNWGGNIHTALPEKGDWKLQYCTDVATEFNRTYF